jgi:hypothetical protein
MPFSLRACRQEHGRHYLFIGCRLDGIIVIYPMPRRGFPYAFGYVSDQFARYAVNMLKK